MGLFGLSVKKIEKNLKPLMKKINLANAPKGYSKSSIDYVASVDTDKACPSCSAKYTYLFATEYKNTFEFEVYYKKTRSINGKKYGPWRHSTACFVTFGGLPIKDFVKSQAKLKELFPEFSFNFNKDSVEIYVFYSDTDNLKAIENAVYSFARVYRSTNIVDTMNGIHDKFYEKK